MARVGGRFGRWWVALAVLWMAAPVHAATCHLYRVAVSGVVANSFGQQGVAVNQFAFWRDEGFRGNPIEFGLFVAHDLNASARIGEIVLMTNTAFSPNPGVSSQRFDLAQVSVGGTVAQFQLDAGASFILPPTNVLVTPGFTSAPGGLGGLEFLPGAGGALGRQLRGATILQTTFVYPRNGTGAFQLNADGSIVGQLSVAGSGVDNAGFEGFLEATFSGAYLGAQTC